MSTKRLWRSASVSFGSAAGGFEVAAARLTRWPTLPTPRRLLAEPFRSLPDDELRIANFGMLLRKPR